MRLRLVYDIVLSIIFAGFAVGATIRALFAGGNILEGWKSITKELAQRLGYLPRADGHLQDRGQSIWIHAASVGEVVAAKPIADEIQRLYPDYDLVFTTVTRAGYRMAQTTIKGAKVVTYVPVDISWVVRRFIKRVNPRLLVLLESEFWPNLITLTHAASGVVIVANRQMNDNSYNKHKRFQRSWLAIAKRGIDHFCVQSPRDKERLIDLGIQPDGITVTGNTKFDSLKPGGDNAQHSQRLLAEMKLAADDLVLVAGSTHANEEEVIITAYRELSREFPQLVLILAPRHMERVADVDKLLAKFDLAVVRRSAIAKRNPDRDRVILLDTIGELMAVYGLADIVFVGGSLVPVGGHNVLEPAAAGKAMLFGPHMFNFKDSVELLLERQAALQVREEGEITPQIRELITNEAKRHQLGENARQFIEENRGAVAKTLRVIQSRFSHQG